jgi:hypothetical protein
LETGSEERTTVEAGSMRAEVDLELRMLKK